MKTKFTAIAFGGLAALLLEGCIAFPPLIQVEHKDTPSNQDIVKRLDAIDNRLKELEKSSEKTEQKSEQK